MAAFQQVSLTVNCVHYETVLAEPQTTTHTSIADSTILVPCDVL